MKAIAILAAGAGLVLATSAGAAVYDFTFTGLDFDIVGQVTATPYAGDVDQLTGLTGTLYFEGEDVGPVSLGPTGWAGPGYPDNLVYPNNDAGGPGSGYVDLAGIGLSFSGEGENFYLAIFAEAPGEDGLYIAPVDDLDSGEIADAGTFTLAVPEPAAWALMLAGFAGLGALLRTRRETTNTVA
jgi:hypothetical protein